MDLIILHVSNGRKNYEIMCFTFLLLSFINDDKRFISIICDLNNGLTNSPGLVSLLCWFHCYVMLTQPKRVFLDAYKQEASRLNELAQATFILV